MFAIAGALLGLILLLATLQYRWLGQISGAERERMTANLNTRAAAFAQDFDREVTRAYLLFQMDPTHPDANPAAGLAARHDRWQATARFPRMIKDVYLVSPPEGGTDPGQPQRFNPSARILEPADWPAQLAEVRVHLAKSAHSGTGVSTTGSTPGATIVMRSMVPTIWPAIPALVIPTPLLMLTHIAGSAPSVQMSSTARYTVLMLDPNYIKGEMLPGLATQHFQGTGDGFDYQLAVVPAAATPSAAKGPVYQSVAEFAPAPDAPVDARIDLFQVRVKDFEPLANEVNRFTTFVALARPPGGGQAQAQTRAIVRETIASAHSAVPSGGPPVSIVVQGSGAGSMQQRIGGLLSGTTASFGARISAPGPAHWRLLVKHPSGSLEQAVNSVRRRNLIVSTSILAILGLSVGFLVLSTRRAQDLARQQLEFVATVSHELRTPLAVIRSAADNLADGVVHDEARIRQYGQLVRREGLRLTDLVEQILEFAGLQSGQKTMTPRPVEMRGLLREVVAAAQATGPEGMTIELELADDLPLVAGDEAALRRVFQNLVGNAIKYGADGRWIGIRGSAAGGRVEISVTDRGIGIPAAEQAKVFDPFYRAPGVVAAQIQGAGLGLSLVKRIVEAHAGQVTLESAPGQGSTFTVTLPAAGGDVAEGHDEVSQAAALS